MMRFSAGSVACGACFKIQNATTEAQRDTEALETALENLSLKSA